MKRSLANMINTPGNPRDIAACNVSLPLSHAFSSSVLSAVHAAKWLRLRTSLLKTLRQKTYGQDLTLKIHCRCKCWTASSFRITGRVGEAGYRSALLSLSSASLAQLKLVFPWFHDVYELRSFRPNCCVYPLNPNSHCLAGIANCWWW